MKNLSLTILLVFVPFFLQADNWELFPFNQKTYYYFQTGDVESIAPYYMDFEEVTGGEVLQYPLRAYIESLGACYPPTSFYGDQKLTGYYSKSQSMAFPEAFVNPVYEYSINMPELEINVEIIRRDSILFYNHSSIGDSWEIHSETFKEQNFPFSHLVITCVSTAIEEIIENVEDSTKTFHVRAFEGENMVSSDFDEVNVKLSKKYGLIEWTPFLEWLNYDLKTHILLAGFEDMNGTVKGERTPLVTDFFPYKVGDFLKIQEEYWNNEGNVTAIHSDIVTDVIRTDNTISYTFNRQTTTFTALWDNTIGYTDTIESAVIVNDNLTTTHIYFPQHYIDLAYWEIGIDTSQIYGSGDYQSASYDNISLQRVKDSDCGIAYVLNTENTTCSGSVNVNTEITAECEILCTAEHCNFCPSHFYHSNLGLIAIRGTGENHLDLIEASIGDCYFTNIKEEESYFASQITLHPNPTTNRFVLRLQNPKQSLQNQNLQLKITDIHGRTLQQMPLSQPSIEVDLSEYSNGIYLVQISDGESWWTEKVVKY